MPHHRNAEHSDRASALAGEEERRAAPRHPCRGAAEVRVLSVDVRIPATLLDLSISGCSVETSAPMPSIEHPQVEILLSLNGFKQRLAGIVRHLEDDRRAGIEFIDVTKRKAEQIEEIIAELALIRQSLLEQQ